MAFKSIVILGPTAAGKTSLSLLIAQKFHLSIISADCFGVYQGMAIGTGQLPIGLRQGIEHFLIGTVAVNQAYNIFTFQTALQQIYAAKPANFVPIIVGGSHLYVEAFLKNYYLHHPARSLKFAHLDNEQILTQIAKLDPEKADQCQVNNRKRNLRVLEILDHFQTPWRLIPKQTAVDNAALIFYLKPDRAWLYEQINQRVLKMLACGWVDEVATLVKTYPDFLTFNSAKAIGYQAIARSLLFQTPFLVGDIQQQTRRLAKRQYTWCNQHYSTAHIINPLVPDYAAIFRLVVQFLNYERNY